MVIESFQKKIRSINESKQTFGLYLKGYCFEVLPKVQNGKSYLKNRPKFRSFHVNSTFCEIDSVFFNFKIV